MPKRVLITGGTRGVGLAMAARLKRDGYDVIATGRKPTESLTQLIESGEGPGTVQFRALELGRHDTFQPFVAEVVKEGGPLYGLINNAALGLDGVLATMHDSQIAELVNVNVLGTILFTKYAHRSMLARREGRIVNVSSIIAHTGFNGLSVYAATKAALQGFTRSLARELGRVNITVNAIAPGYMATDMSSGLDDEKLGAIRRRSPLGRLAETQDVAAMAAFLLSEDARNITGTCQTVDAGSTA
ncbi:MAG TPA: SDR family oxidoreductase [Verrucomicrobiales bacterium]|nr:SDR family oxidoreductase [Verrucomicrobiales bacterium]